MYYGHCMKGATYDKDILFCPESTRNLRCRRQKVTIRQPDGSLSYGETRKVRKISNNLILAVAGWEQRGQYIERIIDDLLSFGDLKYPEEFAGSASVYLRAQSSLPPELGVEVMIAGYTSFKTPRAFVLDSKRRFSIANEMRMIKEDVVFWRSIGKPVLDPTFDEDIKSILCNLAHKDPGAALVQRGVQSIRYLSEKYPSIGGGIDVESIPWPPP